MKKFKINLQETEKCTTPPKEKAPIENSLSNFHFKKKIQISKSKVPESPPITEKESFLSKINKAKSIFEERKKSKNQI